MSVDVPSPDSRPTSESPDSSREVERDESHPELIPLPGDEPDAFISIGPVKKPRRNQCGYCGCFRGCSGFLCCWTYAAHVC